LLRSTTMKAVASVSLESFRRTRLLGMRLSSNVPSKCSQTSGHPVCWSYKPSPSSARG
jgi:hypothetical protein